MVEVLKNDFIEAAKKVVGNDYRDDYQVGRLIMDEVRSMLESKGVEQKVIDQINFQLPRREKQVVYITYRLHNIICFNIKKKKGDRHWCYGSSYHDWTIKDIVANDYSMSKTIKNEATGLYHYESMTLEESINIIENAISESQAGAARARELQCAAIKFIAEKFNMEIDEVQDLCSAINKNWYSLTESNYDEETKHYVRTVREV